MTSLKGKLIGEERKLLELKYSGKRFIEMTDDERWFSAQTLILKIHAITGWSIPISEMMDILIDQFQQKLVEDYKNVTSKEFEYAFRTRGLDIKDWGKALNLILIDEVMLPYLDNRFDLSMQEQKINAQLKMKEEDQQALNRPPMSKEEWDEWLSDISKYEICKIPCASYDYLERVGEINLTKDEKHSYMERSITHISGTIDPVSREGIEFSQMKNKGVFSREVTASLITTSKRLAVFDYFNKKENGK